MMEMKSDFSKRSPAEGKNAVLTIYRKKKSSQTYRKGLHSEGGKTLRNAVKRIWEMSISVHVQNCPGQGLWKIHLTLWEHYFEKVMKVGDYYKFLPI